MAEEIINIEIIEDVENINIVVDETIEEVTISIQEITNTSDLINDGSDGVHPFITLQNIPAINNLVPYTGATLDVDLGEKELTTGKLWLYDEVAGGDEKGSLHYADEALHFENSDGETLMYIEPGFMQLHKTGTIQSNFFTTNLTQNRDHYLPDNSGTIALTSDITGINSGTNTGDETAVTIKSKLGITTLSGSNTGDQDLSNLVVKNTAITGATKTKITYDTKGLVTSGTDATTADIADSTNKRYVTDANLTTIGNQSGTNSGDETTATIKTKLGITTLSGSNTGDQDLSGYVSKTAIETITGKKTLSPTVTASGAIAQGTILTPTLTAAANNDVLVGIEINPTFTLGAFTGTTSAALRVSGNIIPSANATYDLGTPLLNFTRVRAQNVVSNGALSLYSGGNLGLTVASSTNILIGTTVDTASSILKLESTTKGFLPPRMTNAQRAAITSPAVGLMVYCTDTTEGVYVYKSTGWAMLL